MLIVQRSIATNLAERAAVVSTAIEAIEHSNLER